MSIESRYPLVQIILFIVIAILSGFAVSEFLSETIHMAKLFAEVFVVLLLASIFFLKKHIQSNIFLLLISSYIGLFAINSLLEWKQVKSIEYLVTAKLHPIIASYDKQQRRINAAKSAGLHYDSRSKLEIVNDYRADGKKVTLPTCAWHSTKFGQEGAFKPVSGRPYAQTVLCNEIGYYAVSPNDRYGFTNPDQVYSIAKNDNIANRILVLGDSFARGLCVPTDQTVAGELRRLGRSAISMGCAPGGVRSNLAVWREYGASVIPGHVVYFYFEGNDILDVEWSRGTFLDKYLDKDFSQHLIQNSDKLGPDFLSIENANEDSLEVTSDSINVWNEESAKARIENEIQLLRKAENDAGNTLWKRLITIAHIRAFLGILSYDDSTSRDEEKKFRNLLDEMLLALDVLRADVEASGAKFHVVYIPTFSSVERNGKRSVPRIGLWDMRDVVLAKLQERGISVFDFEPVVLNASDPLAFFPFSTPGHFTQKGYRTLGAFIEKSIYGTTDNSFNNLTKLN